MFGRVKIYPQNFPRRRRVVGTRASWLTSPPAATESRRPGTCPPPSPMFRYYLLHSAHGKEKRKEKHKCPTLGAIVLCKLWCTVTVFEDPFTGCRCFGFRPNESGFRIRDPGSRLYAKYGSRSRFFRQKFYSKFWYLYLLEASLLCWYCCGKTNVEFRCNLISFGSTVFKRLYPDLRIINVCFVAVSIVRSWDQLLQSTLDIQISTRWSMQQL